MIRGLSGSRALAAFVLAFLCLNVSGALCLSWCLQGPATTATAASDDSQLSEHCRQMKRQAEQADQDSSRIEAGEAACCMMPVALFAAPVEKRVELAKVVAVAALPAVEIDFAPPVIAYQQAHAKPVYRPPPIDHRQERLLNCVIRI